MQPTRPIPEVCDNCASPSIEFKLIPNAGTAAAYFWACRACGASTGCHHNTNIPLGIMATRRVRRLRAKAHDAFDPLWRSGLFTREGAYRWLARQLFIPDDDAHIGWFTVEQLELTIVLSAAYFAENSHKAEQRIQRRVAAQQKEKHREHERNKRDRANTRAAVRNRFKQCRRARSIGPADKG